MSANPHANGGLAPARPAPARLPRLRRRGDGTRRRHGRVHAGHGQVPPRRDEAEHGGPEFPALQPGREQLEPLAGRARGHQSRLDRGDLSLGRPPGARRPGDGDAQRAPVPGLARGLSADRPARLLLVLRGVHPHHRFDVQSARQVAEGLQPHSVAAADRLAELSACRATSGARTTTASATRIRASSTTSSTRKPRSSASICRPTPTACCRSPTIACAAGTTSTSSSPASSRRRSG